MSDKPRVLFLCTGNSCRSQMAEGWLRTLADGRLVSLSAGTDPHGLNPLAVRAMAEAGVDISGQSSDPIQAYLDDPPELVIAVCTSAAESCPTLPGATRVLRWPFDDPAGASGTDEEVFAVFRRVRDEIRERLAAWLAAGAEPLALAR
ncbi:MAG: arsenate reductase ArsC [Planctomycetota bacterium]